MVNQNWQTWWPNFQSPGKENFDDEKSVKNQNSYLVLLCEIVNLFTPSYAYQLKLQKPNIILIILLSSQKIIISSII